jgi:hypothetical protein
MVVAGVDAAVLMTAGVGVAMCQRDTITSSAGRVEADPRHRQHDHQRARGE